jgi:hypothetical protein
MWVDRAVSGGSLQVLAVPLDIAGDDVGEAQIPSQDAFVDVLPGQGEPHPTAGCVAQVHPALAVDVDLSPKGVFVQLESLRVTPMPLSGKRFSTRLRTAA